MQDQRCDCSRLRVVIQRGLNPPPKHGPMFLIIKHNRQGKERPKKVTKGGGIRTQQRRTGWTGSGWPLRGTVSHQLIRNNKISGAPTSQAGIRDKVGETHCEREVWWYLFWKEKKKKEKKVDEGGVKKGGFFFITENLYGVAEKRGRARTCQVTY